MDIDKLLNKYIDKEYLNFQKKIITTKTKILGIRIPTLRKISKELSKKYSYQEIFLQLNENIFEHLLLKAFIIANQDFSIKDKIELINKFLLKIDNWCICDTFVNELKTIKFKKKEFFNYLKKLLYNKNTFHKRFAIVCFLTYYIDDLYIDFILDSMVKIDSHDYYVTMAISWCYSYCFINFFDKTKAFFETKKELIKPIIITKTKQKCYDSFRITPEQKKIIKNL